MSDVAIRAVGLSKRYRIGSRNERYRTARDRIADRLASPFRRLSARTRQHASVSGTPAPSVEQSIWALKDCSFEVCHGEVVGVIGRNGAGKSTLLKILSRITDPTEGFAEIRGRVGSLLEVGTGFHLELTGRENIYLNGAILGMKRHELNRRFDDIVDFAEVARFIDTPVKHYSTGMHLRLAFSVAAHLEPDILLVDEVLAVGDHAFQKKCLGKMEDVAAEGRTVLFVSHNLGVVKELCQTSLVLANGLLDFRGPVVEGLAHYSRSLFETADEPTTARTGWRGIRLNDRIDGLAPAARHEPLTVEAWLDLGEVFLDGRLFGIVHDASGNDVVHLRVDTDALWSGTLAAGRYQVRVELPPLWLAPGLYTVYLKFLGRRTRGGDERYVSDRALLDVAGSVEGLGRALLAPSSTWRLSRVPAQERVEVALGGRP